MEMGLGSYPGSSNLLEWTTTSYGDGIETYIELAGINDGELVFASLQVLLYTVVSHFHVCMHKVTNFSSHIPCRYGMEPD